MMEQQYQEGLVQVKLWKEKFYEEQNKHQEARAQLLEIRSQYDQFSMLTTQNELDKQKIRQLEIELQSYID